MDGYKQSATEMLGNFLKEEHDLIKFNLITWNASLNYANGKWRRGNRRGGVRSYVIPRDYCGFYSDKRY